MALEKVGNLGQVQLMQRLVNKKVMDAYDSEDGSITLGKEEAKELEQLLNDFHYVLSNLCMWENALNNDQYGGLVSVIKNIKEKDLY